MRKKQEKRWLKRRNKIINDLWQERARQQRENKFQRWKRPYSRVLYQYV